MSFFSSMRRRDIAGERGFLQFPAWAKWYGYENIGAAYCSIGPEPHLSATFQPGDNLSCSFLSVETKASVRFAYSLLWFRESHTEYQLLLSPSPPVAVGVGGVHTKLLLPLQVSPAPMFWKSLVHSSALIPTTCTRHWLLSPACMPEVGGWREYCFL